MKRFEVNSKTKLQLQPIFWIAVACVFCVLLPLTTRSQSISSAPNLLPGQSATQLANSQWLLVGGESVGGGLNTASIWDSQTSSTTQLTAKLNQGRAWHTATILPDGLVLILGGLDNNRQVVPTAEVYDPATQNIVALPAKGVTARARHTATLLTDGEVLIAGGVGSNGQMLQSAELWDAMAPKSTVIKSGTTARQNHAATLLSDGRVLLWGGTDGNGGSLNNGDLFDPATGLFSSLDSYPTAFIMRSTDQPALVASIPLDRTVDVETESMIALRFSKPLRAETVNASTVSLSGPKGIEKIAVVPAENGSLAFLTPEALLLPGATYTVTVNGAIDQNGLLLAVSGISFSTKPAVGGVPAPTPIGTGLQPVTPAQPLPSMTPSVGADGWTWIGKLINGRAHSDWEDLPKLQGAPGVTALSGQALDIQGLPLAHVTLKFESEYGSESKAVSTDDTGRFLLTDIKPGWGALVVDGRQGRNPNSGVQNPKWGYGVYEYGTEIKKGQTNALDFTIWLTKIDADNAVKIPSPTTAEAVITSPRIPGLELRLPPTAEVTDHEGKKVDEISLTQIPLDRTPFPLAAEADVPIYFTAQPGAAYVKTSVGIGARIHYPNLRGQPAGERFQFWHYDPGYHGWYIYGLGRVSADGSQIIPDEGVSIYEFTGAMVDPAASGPTSGPECRTPGCRDGDPVDLQTGLFVHEKTDLMLPDVLPISLTRTYRNKDNVSRQFGRGATHPYQLLLTGDNITYQYMEMVLADGGRVRFDRITPGTGFTDAVLEATKSPNFYKSKIAWNGNGWDMTHKDGSVYVFGDVAPLQAIRDRYGNQITILRNNGQRGNIIRITAVPSGRWIDFTYDASKRITQVKDNLDRTVGFQYDSDGRVWKVTDPMLGVTEYEYDAGNRMTRIKDPRGNYSLTIEYDQFSRVSKQTQADGSTYQFAYTSDVNGKIIQTEVTDPRGNIRRVEFNTGGQMIRDTKAVGKPEEQVIDYERQAGTNLLLSVTDALEITPGVRRKTAYTYDAKGNMLTTTRMAQDVPANQVTTTYTYQPLYNQVATITDPLNHTTTLTYDNLGHLTTVQDPLGNQTTYTYNFSGQPLTVTTPAGTTQFVYDFGDLVSVIDPLGNVTNRNLDAIGRSQSMTNALGLTTSYSYDNLNRMTGVTDPLVGLTGFGYDPNSNLLSVSDAKAPSGVTGYSYDNMDRLQTRNDPLLKNESYVYDAAGNLTLFRDRKLQATVYGYDALNRRTTSTYADASNTTYVYDKANRLTQINDSTAGIITRGYDGLDRLTSEQTPQGTVGYTYDAASRRATMTVPGQSTVVYSYDNANRLTQITQGTSIVQFGYDNANRRTSLTLPNAIVVEYAYDVASRVTGITYKQNGTTVIGDLTYEYDKSGNRTKTGGSWVRTGMPEPVTTTSYDANNRQLTFGDKTLAYDDNGNLQSITDSNGTTLYGWNARNQLVGINGPNVNASFVYDGMGRREKKTINGSLTEFLYDGLNSVQETSGAAILANTLPGLGLDEFLTRTDVGSGITSNLLTNALGSAIALADSAGVVQAELTYEPFGRSSTTGAVNSNPYQFTGRENDGTDVFYYRARYYHPVLQRFLSEDPIGTPTFATCPTQRDILLRLVASPSGHALELFNLYAYVRNNPVVLRDPTGLLSSCVNYFICNITASAFCVMVCHSFGGGLTPLSMACDIACYMATSAWCNQQFPCPPPPYKPR